MIVCEILHGARNGVRNGGRTGRRNNKRSGGGPAGHTLSWIFGLAAVFLFQTSAVGQGRPAPRLIVPALIPAAEDLESIRIHPDVQQVVAALGSADFGERLRAMHALREARLPPAAAPLPTMLAAMLHREPLDIEQRSRMLRVLRELMIDAPRGALGITMNPRALEDPDHPGVEIVELVDGMPAANVLRSGDRITHIEGVPLGSSEDLIVLVQTRDPGDTVRLTVFRPVRSANGELTRDAEGRPRFETMTADVALGSSANLISPNARGAAPASPVVTRRTMEWNELVRAHAPIPTMLEPATHDPLGIGRQLFVQPAPQLPNFRVDDHEIIRALRAQLTDILDGRLALTNTLLEQWQRTHLELLHASRQTGLEPHEREVFTRLADRYNELLRLLEIPGRR